LELAGDTDPTSDVLKVLLMVVPRAVTAPMMTAAIRAASRPYSTAEAPSSSRTNLVMARSMVFLLIFCVLFPFTSPC